MTIQQGVSGFSMSDFLSQINIEQLNEHIVPVALLWSGKVLAALAILIIGLLISGRLRAFIRSALSRAKKIDPIVVGFLSSLVYYAALVAVFIAVIGTFGVPIASFAAIFGAAGLAVGLAMQGTLSHVAAGVMLLIFRPFRLGDFIKTGGFEGTIRDINLFFTELATLDNRKVILPNGMVWNDAIVNFAALGRRRLDIVFGISYSDDIDHAQSVIQKVVDESDLVIHDPAPIIEVDSLGDFSVNILCRVWCKADVYLDTKWQLNKRVKQAFDREGVTIPFPTAIQYEYQAEQKH